MPTTAAPMKKPPHRRQPVGGVVPSVTKDWNRNMPRIAQHPPEPNPNSRLLELEVPGPGKRPHTALAATRFEIAWQPTPDGPCLRVCGQVVR